MVRRARLHPARPGQPGAQLAHAMQTRLETKKGAGDDRIFKLVDSSSMPAGQCTVSLTPGGIRDQC